jgi:hypothetical protein
LGTNYDLNVDEGVLDANPALGCDMSSSSSHDSGIACCSSFPNGIATGDLNNDGVPDIVMSDEASDSFHTAAVAMASGFGLGNPTAIPSVSRISAFAIADFNGDGKLDLAGAEWGPGVTDQNLIAIHQGQGSTSQFDSPQSIQVFGTTGQDTYPKIAVADLNGDGKPDIVTDGDGCNEPAETSCSTQITVLLNTTQTSGGGGPGGGGAFPGAKLLHGTFTVKHGAIKLKVTCPAGGFAQCIGKDTLTTIKAFPAAVRHRVSLGSARFSIAAGQTKTLTIKLTHKALKLLAKVHKLKALERVLAHDPAGQSKTTQTTVTIKLPAKHR